MNRWQSQIYKNIVAAEPDGRNPTDKHTFILIFANFFVIKSGYPGLFWKWTGSLAQRHRWTVCQKSWRSGMWPSAGNIGKHIMWVCRFAWSQLHVREPG